MNRQLYFDYCATTPVHPEVRAAMLDTLEADFGNPSSMHWAGRRAAERVAQARAEVAAGIGCGPQEIYFTSGATEADNLALLGVMRQFEPGRAHLITSAVEHHAILHAAQELERAGYAVTYVPVDAGGRVDPEAVRQALRPDTALISLMLVNNEVGAIQPVAEVGALARAHGVRLHTDAVQALGLLEVQVDRLNVDLLSLSGHKIYGPKGIGALYVREGVRVQPLIYGGAQEKSLRPGTENVPGIVGLGAAVRLTQQHKPEARVRLAGLRQALIRGLGERVPGVTVNGPAEQVAPHVLSVSFPKTDGEMLLVRLNGEGVAASLGSACTSHSIEPSHVLTAMGLPLEQIEGTLRISLGYPTQASEVDELLEILPGVVRRARATDAEAE
jgi:cysteine desulfurase